MKQGKHAEPSWPCITLKCQRFPENKDVSIKSISPFLSEIQKGKLSRYWFSKYFAIDSFILKSYKGLHSRFSLDLGGKYHSSCFNCDGCKANITGPEGFINHLEKLYCHSCYEKNIAEKCKKCEKVRLSRGKCEVQYVTVGFRALNAFRMNGVSA